MLLGARALLARQLRLGVSVVCVTLCACMAQVATPGRVSSSVCVYASVCLYGQQEAGPWICHWQLAVEA